MGEGAVEREADYFRRVESRLVACELEVDRFDKWVRKYEPIVDELRDRNMLADAIADRMKESRRELFTRLNIAIAFAAILIPPVITALLVRAIS